MSTIKPANFNQYEQYVIERQIFNPNPLLNERYLLRFENGYAASIIRGNDTYGGRDGLWEVMLLRYTIDDSGTYHYHSRSRNLQSNDGLFGWLTPQSLEEKLEYFKSLPSVNVRQEGQVKTMGYGKTSHS